MLNDFEKYGIILNIDVIKQRPLSFQTLVAALKKKL